MVCTGSPSGSTGTAKINLMKARSRESTWRQRNRDRGLCSCGKGREPGRSSCRKCLDRQRIYCKNQSVKWRKSGKRCSSCGRKTLLLICDICRRKNNHRRNRNRHLLKGEVFLHYGERCSFCGIENPRKLTVDHINGGGHRHRQNIRKGGGSEDFYRWLRNHNYPEGYQVLCWNCNWMKHLESRILSEEPKAIKKREAIQVLRRDVFGHYGMKCTKCGEEKLDVLTIDHVENNGAEHRRQLGRLGGPSFYRWLRKQGYPKDGYQVLCRNCNSSKSSLAWEP